MVKFSDILGNLFNKTGSSKLETDASPLPPRPKGNKGNTPSTSTSSITTPEANGDSQTGDADAQPIETLRPDNSTLVPAFPNALQPMPDGSLTPASSVVNNFQQNTLAAPQTSISNTTGMQVFQIKNSSNLHIGNSFTFNNPVKDECASTSGLSQASNVKWANLKLSNTISQMMLSQEEVDTEVLDVISRHLGYEWKRFARRLEYSDGQIDAFEADHPTLSEQIYHFVLDWTRNDDDPTLGRLVTLLWTNKHKETVYYIKQIWKKKKEAYINESNS
ncbi:protein immune deficiency [Anopheles ziemanni]|uniref:protein immune deficiency n=1 Tax=Anopheles coustani TaxID=139045 RepID=UPI0026581E7A|nr:protein immune deficiency [Anopheles coustani]XP_058166714.1 protein immune deficiency [Anopheles ziemanni]